MADAAFIGLSTQEAAQKAREGLENRASTGGGRTYWNIIQTNVFSTFNIILYAIGATLLAMGLTSDAITSVGIAILNSFIGTFQEVNAKRKLEKIALLSRPKTIVFRDGRDQEIDPTKIVQGDIVKVAAGDQIDVDGCMVTEGLLEVDESLLTGEADLVRKEDGGNLLSGSVCMTGSGYYRAEKVGGESFANQVTAAAKNFQLVKTPLQKNIDFVVRLLMLVVLIMSLLILAASIIEDLSTTRIVQIAAVMTGQVPYGLFFLIVVAYALGTNAIARQGALVQQSNAVESLSNINVLCTDKTGTLTANKLEIKALIPLFGFDQAEGIVMLGDFARGATSTNKTGEAIIAGTSGSELPISDEVSFSSARKWSAVAFDHPQRRGAYVLGAVEMLKPYLSLSAKQEADLMSQISAPSDRGLRVLLFAYNPEQISLHSADGAPLIENLQPIGIVTIGDELRPRVKETIEAFTDMGIRLKVISGDNPRTVAALAKQAGLPDDIKLYSGLELAEAEDEQFRRMADEGTIFGRITPDQKERLVNSLLEDGQYVAMIGDGVNDVLSLKKASLGIAMQSGSNATRNVADMVLLGDSFAALEPAFDKGKVIIGAVTNAIYVTLVRSLTAMFLIVGIVMIGLPFPFDPAQIALVSYTVGGPTALFTFFAPPEKLDPHLVKNLFRFAIPIALTSMLFGIVIYAVSYYIGLNALIEIDLPDRVVRSYENYTGVTFGADGYAESFATIFAQTSLSLFIGVVSMLVVYFLYPPFKFFAVWREEAVREWRISILNLGLIVLLLVIYSVRPIAQFVGLLPQPPIVLYTLLALAVLWTLIVRWLLKHKILDPFFNVG
ncbi:MAG: HAD-IC family P-type ATPase [Chloroflexota bacterium]